MGLIRDFHLLFANNGCLFPIPHYPLFLTMLFLYLITIELKAFKKINKSVAVFINAIPTLHKKMEFMSVSVLVCVCVCICLLYDHLDLIVSVVFFVCAYFMNLHLWWQILWKLCGKDDGKKVDEKCHTNNLWKTHHNLTNPKQVQLKHKTN